MCITDRVKRLVDGIMQHSGIVNFRAEPQLVEAINASARQSGVSASEFIRQAVEARLANVDAPAPTEAGEIDPFSKLAAAARGSLEAQRAVANQAIKLAFQEGRDAEKTLLEGLVFARLAASHGHIEDQGLVISMIALLSEVVGEDAVPSEVAEALARIEWIANQSCGGVEPCADFIASLSYDPIVSAEVMAEAKDISRRMRAGETA
jgi:hypothetical protein